MRIQIEKDQRWPLLRAGLSVRANRGKVDVQTGGHSYEYAFGEGLKDRAAK